MIKNTLAAVVASVALLGAVAPAFAEPVPAATEDEAPVYDLDRAQILLQQQGVDTDTVELWGNLVRAYVNVDGTQTMQFFDKDTLAPVSL